MESIDKLIEEVDFLTTYKDVITGHDSDVVALCLKLNEEVQETKKGIDGLRLLLNEQKEQISVCKELSRALKDTEQLIDHMSNNLPNKYVYTGNSDGIELLEAHLAIATLEDLSPVPAGERYVATPDSCYRRWHSVETLHTRIAYLKFEEFDKIPRYTRGRVTYQAVNKFIDQFNTALNKKYEIFGRPRAELRGKMLAVYDRFKREETQETIAKGIYFCTGEDLKSYSDIKMDKSSHNFLNILRSAQRIREIRNASILRYAVL